MSAVNDPVWVYGEPVLLQSVGTAPDDRWAYGEPLVVMEYYEASGEPGVLPILMAHMGQFNGGMVR